MQKAVYVVVLDNEEYRMRQLPLGNCTRTSTKSKRRDHYIGLFYSILWNNRTAR